MSNEIRDGVITWQITTTKEDQQYGFQVLTFSSTDISDPTNGTWGAVQYNYKGKRYVRDLNPNPLDPNGDYENDTSTNNFKVPTPGTYTVSFDFSLSGVGYCKRLHIGHIGGDLVSAIISAPVVSPEMYAGCSKITNIPIAKKVSIWENLINLCTGCSSLKYASIDLSSNSGNENTQSNADLQGIFSGCSALEVVEFYNGNAVFKNDSFSGCTALERVTIGGSGTFVHSQFRDSVNLKDIYVSSDAIFNNDALNYCEGIERLNVMGNIQCGARAFANCKNLKEIYANTMTINGNGVFYDCQNLERIVATKMTLAGDGNYTDLFYNNNKIIKIPTVKFGTFESMNFNNAFYKCASLKNIPLNIPIGEYTALYMSNMYSGCYNIKGTVDLSFYENRTDADTLIGQDCFFGCFKLGNYTSVSAEWGGGFTLTGDTELELAGQINTLLSVNLNTELSKEGEELEIHYVAESLPEGFSLSADGIISGITNQNIIGAYYVDIVWEEYVVETITVNFRITDLTDIAVDIGTVGFKLGNKFIKIVV